MEAGKRLRLRKWTYPTSQINRNGSDRFQSPYDNRWATYSAPEHINASESHHEAPSAQPTTQTRTSIAQLQIPQEPEGSLLQAFRTELAKIITPNNNAGKPPTPSMETKTGGDASQSVSVSSHVAPAPSLEVRTTKLVLQAVHSICSNVTTLNSQLRHQVQDAIPMLRLLSVSDLNVESACKEFWFETDRVVHDILHKELDSDLSAGESVQQTDADLLTNGVCCLRKIMTEFEHLTDRLLTADSMGIKRDYNQSYLVIDPVCEKD